MKKSTSRISFDIPTKEHKQLKTLSSAYGVTMKDMFIKAIPHIKQNLVENDPCKLSSHMPNADTIRAIKNVEARKKLKTYKNVGELFKKLGI